MPPEKTPKTGKGRKISPPDGKLGVLLPGIGGAVSTTFIVGVESFNKGAGEPIGSLTQMGTIRLGKRTARKSPKIKELFPLADCKDLVFGGWDISDETCRDAAIRAGVLNMKTLDEVKNETGAIRPMKAVFNKKYVKNLSGSHVKKGKTKMDLADQLIDDIAEFKKRGGLRRAVMVWCGSTETYIKPSIVHDSVQKFEKGLKNNHPDIAPSMIYAYAAIKSGVPYANGAPNLSADIPALVELAKKRIFGFLTEGYGRYARRDA